jgi:hypothetical protein
VGNVQTFEFGAAGLKAPKESGRAASMNSQMFEFLVALVCRTQKRGKSERVTETGWARTKRGGLKSVTETKAGKCEGVTETKAGRFWKCNRIGSGAVPQV